MALLLVGMDPSSSPDLQREIMLAVDLLCQSVAPNADVSAEIVSSDASFVTYPDSSTGNYHLQQTHQVCF
jgi:hypothetical protein